MEAAGYGLKTRFDIHQILEHWLTLFLYLYQHNCVNIHIHMTQLRVNLIKQFISCLN